MTLLKSMGSFPRRSIERAAPVLGSNSGPRLEGDQGMTPVQEAEFRRAVVPSYGVDAAIPFRRYTMYSPSGSGLGSLISEFLHSHNEMWSRLFSRYAGSRPVKAKRPRIKACVAPAACFQRPPV